MTQSGSTAVPGQAVEQKNDAYTYTLDSFLRVSSVQKNAQPNYLTYTYDGRGNQTRQVENILAEGSNPARTETTDYTYDLQNQLISTDKTIVPDPNDPDKEQETVNRYNGDGQRTRQEVNGAAERYMYMGSALLYSCDANAVKMTQNILDPGGRIVASRRDYGDGMDSAGVSNWYFYHYDLRGSVTNIVSARKKTDGQNVSAANPVEIRLIQGYTYDEFGGTDAKKPQSAFKNDVKFTGAVQDVTGLYYMQSRHYDPQKGSFLQQDSYKGEQTDPRTFNLYTYCANNPVNYTDPTGHFINLIVGAIGGFAAGIITYAVANGGLEWEDWGKGEFWAVVGTSTGTGLLAGATFGASLAVTGTAMSGVGTIAATTATTAAVEATVAATGTVALSKLTSEASKNVVRDSSGKSGGNSRDSGYKAPKSGGGVTDSIKYGDTQYTFGHGGRHLNDTNLKVGEVNKAIARDASKRQITKNYTGSITVKGTKIVYRAYRTGNNSVNIGTYFRPR